MWARGSHSPRKWLIAPKSCRLGLAEGEASIQDPGFPASLDLMFVNPTPPSERYASSESCSIGGFMGLGVDRRAARPDQAYAGVCRSGAFAVRVIMNKLQTDVGKRKALKNIAVSLGILVITSASVVTSVQSAHASKALQNLSFNPCIIEMEFGNTQASASHNPGVTGSVDPLTDGVPVNLMFTGTRADSSTRVETFSSTTGFGSNPLGVYSLGFSVANVTSNPFVTWSVLVTSPSISGSTTCLVAVPPEPSLFADGFESP